MAHPATQFARSLVTFFNNAARPWTGTRTAEYRTKLSIPADENAAENFATEKVFVVPMAIPNSELLDRNGAYNETITVGIVIVKKIPSGTAWDKSGGSDWIETELSGVYDVIQELRADGNTIGSFRGITYTQPTVLSDAHLEKNLFVAPITATAIYMT
jgi:hypothetical protein